MLLNIVTCEDDDGNGGGEPITLDQAVEIDTLLTETKSDKARFLKWIGAASVPEIMARDYEKAVRKLNEKRAQK